MTTGQDFAAEMQSVTDALTKYKAAWQATVDQLEAQIAAFKAQAGSTVDVATAIQQLEGFKALLTPLNAPDAVTPSQIPAGETPVGP